MKHGKDEGYGKENHWLLGWRRDRGREKGRQGVREPQWGLGRGVEGANRDQKSFLSSTQLEMTALSLQALALMQ